MTFLGLSVPIPTLFANDGALDTGRNAKFARAISEAKVNHLFLLGSLGEFPSVDDSERPRLLENVIESTVGPADVWVGCGAPSTARAVALAVGAEEMGAAAVVAVPPFYLHPPPAAIERYYRAIRAAVSIPLYAYNIPSLVGYALAPALLHRLGSAGVLVGVKDTAGSLERGLVRSGSSGRVHRPARRRRARPGRDRARSIGRGDGDGEPRPATLRRAPAGGACRGNGAGDGVPGPRRRARASDPRRSVSLGRQVPRRRALGADVGYRAPYDPLTPEEAAAVRARLEPLRPRLQPFLRR